MDNGLTRRDFFGFVSAIVAAPLLPSILGGLPSLKTVDWTVWNHIETHWVGTTLTRVFANDIEYDPRDLALWNDVQVENSPGQELIFGFQVKMDDPTAKGYNDLWLLNTTDSYPKVRIVSPDKTSSVEIGPGLSHKGAESRNVEMV